MVVVALPIDLLGTAHDIGPSTLRGASIRRPAVSVREGASREALAGRVVALLWLGLGLLCVAYIVARSSSAPGMFAVAQLIFLVPVVGSALLTLEAHRIGPAGDERRVWGLLSVAAWLLVGSESYYAWYQLAVDPSGPVAPSINDALNIAAAGTFLVVLGIASGLARYPAMTRMRLYSDAVAVMSLSLMVLCRFWSSGRRRLSQLASSGALRTLHILRRGGAWNASLGRVRVRRSPPAIDAVTWWSAHQSGYSRWESSWRRLRSSQARTRVPPPGRSQS